jgi:hypothetical protein
VGRQVGEYVITNYLAAGRVLSRDELRHATALRKMGQFQRSGAMVDAASILQVVDLRGMRPPLRLMLFDY